MVIVGERINSSRKGIEPALRKRDAEFITKEARDQVEAGAHVIDVNTATLMDGEIESLKWAAQLIQDSLDVPNLVGLCMDDRGMPDSAGDRIRIASDLIGELTKDGVPIGDIYIDPVVTPVSTDTRYGMAVLDAIEAIMEEFPGVHTICGLSNVSFGLPNRKQVNQMFLVMAMTKGLDAVILDPCDKRIMANLITTMTLLGEDDFCMNYITASREGKFD